MKIEDLPGAIIADAVMERHGFKVISEKIQPCEDCNPDGEDRDHVWCNHCRGLGFVWLRTVELDKPIEYVAIRLELKL